MAYLLSRQLATRAAEPVYRCHAEAPDFFQQMNEAAPAARQLTQAELQELADADMVFRGEAATMHDRRYAYVAIEASITGEVDDVTRADRRRELMEKITGALCLAAIVAESLTEPVARALRRKPSEGEKPDRDAIAADTFNAQAQEPHAQDMRDRFLLSQEIETPFRPNAWGQAASRHISQDVNVLYLDTRNSG